MSQPVLKAKRRLFRKYVLAAVVLLALGIYLSPNGGFTFMSAPISMPAGPMTCYRITGQETDGRYFADSPNTIEAYAIVQKQIINDPQLQQDVRGLLSSRLIYGMGGMQCFDPGIAIRLSSGDDAVDVLICLSCQHVYFFQHGKVIATRDLNGVGVARFKAMYGRLFPGHSVDGSDDDMKRATDARDAERDRREREMLEATSEPHTRSAQ